MTVAVMSVTDIRAKITHLLSQQDSSCVFNLQYLIDHLTPEITLTELLEHIDSKLTFRFFIDTTAESFTGVADIQTRQYVLKSDRSMQQLSLQPNENNIQAIDSFFHLESPTYDVEALYPECDFTDPQSVDELYSWTKQESTRYKPLNNRRDLLSTNNNLNKVSQFVSTTRTHKCSDQ